MGFFFVVDFRGKFRFFSSQQSQEIQVEFTRLQRIWVAAKQKLMLLPPRILHQEQALASIVKHEADEVSIKHARGSPEKKIRRRFFFFLQKQRSKHILLLIIEAVLLPVSGLMALLPGPNVFFGILALLMYTQWQALRGIHRLRMMKPLFAPSELLEQWERALDSGDTAAYAGILSQIESEYGISDATKILFK